MDIALGHAINAIDTAVAHLPLPDEEVVAGDPGTATIDIGTFRGVDIGLWEMTPGTATDVEEDEVFVVLAGRARIEFTDRNLATLEVGPGDVVRLEAGMHTRWTVIETLRKIWVA